MLLYPTLQLMMSQAGAKYCNRAKAEWTPKDYVVLSDSQSYETLNDDLMLQGKKKEKRRRI